MQPYSDGSGRICNNIRNARWYDIIIIWKYSHSSDRGPSLGIGIKWSSVVSHSPTTLSPPKRIIFIHSEREHIVVSLRIKREWHCVIFYILLYVIIIIIILYSIKPSDVFSLSLPAGLSSVPFVFVPRSDTHHTYNHHILYYIRRVHIIVIIRRRRKIRGRLIYNKI